MIDVAEFKDRFFDRFTPEPMSGCWLWDRELNHYGYGMIPTLTGKRYRLRAHRVSWELHFGEIPKGLVIMHKCDTPSCVNPEHLALGTHADNVADKVKKRRHHYHSRTHCKKGHPYEGENLYIRTDGGRECRICKRYASKMSARKRTAEKRGAIWAV